MNCCGYRLLGIKIGFNSERIHMLCFMSNLKVFARHGLTQINPIDTKFNPNEHEAVVQQVIDYKL